MTNRDAIIETLSNPWHESGSRWWVPLLVIAAGTAVFWSSLSGAFVLDDHHAIMNNTRIRQLWPMTTVISGRRPVLDATLAMNYAIGGLNVRGYHVANVIIHLLAALTLYGVVGRTLQHRSVRDRFGHASPYIAAAAALLWVVHPLQTQSVTYLVQRSESLMGLFYLLGLYCLIRGVGASRPWPWYAVATIGCALGLGCKGVMVTAPVAILLYDRLCVSGTFGEAIRRRWGLYIGLAATWPVLWVTKVGSTVLSTTNPNANVGFSFRGITPLDYALTQVGVVTHYLRLSLWPNPLCLDYGWPVAETFGAIVPSAVFIGCLLAGTAWACIRRPALGYLGVWFFLVLLPTSSLVPIRDPAFEHRMYLPLASVIVVMLCGGYVAVKTLATRAALGPQSYRALCGLVVACSALALGATASRRNEVYRSELAVWQDVVAKRPENHRGQYNFGRTLLDARRLDEAADAFQRAIQIDPNSEQALYNLGKTRSLQGRSDEAMKWYIAALTVKPNLAEAHSDIGNILVGQNRIEQAIEKYHDAIRCDPTYVRSYYNLGSVLLDLGRTEEAIAALNEAARISPKTARIRFKLGSALERGGLLESALREFEATLRIEANHEEARRALELLPNRMPPH